MRCRWGWAVASDGPVARTARDRGGGRGGRGSLRADGGGYRTDDRIAGGGTGREIQVSASGVGDYAPAVMRLILGGASLRPPTPVHLTTDYAADGSAAVRWIRRSRAGWRWIDGVDAPLVEEAERYRVTVTTGDGRVRVGETTEARWLVSIAERSAGPVRIAVAQRGTITESLPAEITI